VASYFWIAIGSALGGVARYWCSGVAARLIGETFPWGTIIVNIVGSFIIGFFATLTGPDGRIFADTLTQDLPARHRDRRQRGQQIRRCHRRYDGKRA